MGELAVTHRQGAGQGPARTVDPIEVAGRRHGVGGGASHCHDPGPHLVGIKQEAAEEQGVDFSVNSASSCSKQDFDQELDLL